MKAAAILGLVLAAISLRAADVPQAEERIQCEGTIASFEKDGFHASFVDGGSEFFDVTWVVVPTPAEFEGVRHMITSQGSDTPPFGKIGDRITFAATRSWLEFEKYPERYTIDPRKLFPELRGETNDSKKENGSNKPVETTSVTRPEIWESCPHSVAFCSVFHA